MTRYIFITGGVVSSLGKGISAASIACLLQARGYSVRLRKLDPYLNMDPGTMSPLQHGEVYVTEDGAETDLDLGHYERFTGVSARRSDHTTTGKVYSSVLAKERRGDYLGATVQVVPHIIEEIKKFIISDLQGEDFLICEIGGTVGDIESLPYLEAIRQLNNDLGDDQVIYIHLVLLPYIAAAGELKTKPAQHSVKELLSFGIQPDILLCRTEHPLSIELRRKLGLFCNVKPERVFEARDVQTIYEVPLRYNQEGVDQAICRYFGLSSTTKTDLEKWETIVERGQHPQKTIRIGIVGKYVNLLGAYKSLSEAIVHAGIANHTKVDIDWIDAEDAAEIDLRLQKVDGVIVPGAFGERGKEGKIAAIRYARTHKIPYFGICFGMQLAVIEAARHLLNIPQASSTEFGPTDYPFVGLMTQWSDAEGAQKRSAKDDMGGTMRLGAYPCVIQEGTLAATIYKEHLITERHRHRYEVNTRYRKDLESVGIVFSGMSPDQRLPEIIERSDHPWFLAVQFHPELKSRPFAPHPLFVDFVKTCFDIKKQEMP